MGIIQRVPRGWAGGAPPVVKSWHLEGTLANWITRAWANVVIDGVTDVKARSEGGTWDSLGPFNLMLNGLETEECWVTEALPGLGTTLVLLYGTSSGLTAVYSPGGMLVVLGSPPRSHLIALDDRRFVIYKNGYDLEPWNVRELFANNTYADRATFAEVVPHTDYARDIFDRSLAGVAIGPWGWLAPSGDDLAVTYRVERDKVGTEFNTAVFQGKLLAADARFATNGLLQRDSAAGAWSALGGAPDVDFRAAASDGENLYAYVWGTPAGTLYRFDGATWTTDATYPGVYAYQLTSDGADLFAFDSNLNIYRYGV
ncbi:MAG: hypothetical protein ABFE07_28590 [Armatimonadia bacterium]